MIVRNERVEGFLVGDTVFRHTNCYLGMDVGQIGTITAHRNGGIALYEFPHSGDPLRLCHDSDSFRVIYRNGEVLDGYQYMITVTPQTFFGHGGSSGESVGISIFIDEENYNDFVSMLYDIHPDLSAEFNREMGEPSILATLVTLHCPVDNGLFELSYHVGWSSETLHNLFKGVATLDGTIKTKLVDLDGFKTTLTTISNVLGRNSLPR